MIPASQPVRLIRVSPDGWETATSEIIVETPVSLTVNGELWLTFMCTPTELEALAVGFLYNEGWIESAAEIADVRLCPAGDNIDVWLTRSLAKPEAWRRTSGCTGGVTAAQEQDAASAGTNGLVLSASQVGELIARLFESQQLYRTAGGVHTSAISDGRRILRMAEDIGRHNTLDKLAGQVLLAGEGFSHQVILTTGRISSEMLQKARRMGAWILISRTSPSSQSIALAEKTGLTLIGYARRNRFTIYTHPQRILPESLMEKEAHHPIRPAEE